MLTSIAQIFLLYNASNATPKSKTLWLNICLLARLRVVFKKLKETALTLPSFEQVTVILIPRPLATASSSQRVVNLKETFGILQLDLNPATTRAILGHNWIVAKLER